MHRWVLHVFVHGTCADTAFDANVVLHGEGSETALEQVSFLTPQSAAAPSRREPLLTHVVGQRTLLHNISNKKKLCARCSLPLDLDGGLRLPNNLQRVWDNSTSSGRTDQSVTSMS